MPDVPPKFASSVSVIEFGSQNAAAVLGRLRVCFTRMGTSPMLRVAHPHPAQACLAFANPSTSSGIRIRHALASGFAQSYARTGR